MTTSYTDGHFQSEKQYYPPKKLVAIHQRDRSHVTKDDIERLAAHGFILLFVEFVNDVRFVTDQKENEDA